MQLPASLQQQLSTLKQEDNLEKWLYARIDYVDAAPVARIGFLMNTQQAAWRSFKTYDERLAWFNLLILQGYYQLQTGNILSSINGYEAALQFYDAYPLPDADNVTDYLLKPLGNNYTRLGDYNTALYIHDKALQLARKKGSQQEVAAAYSNMAICARWKGDLTAASQYAQAGLRTVSRQSALYGLLLSTRAEVLTEEGRYDTAALVSAQALQWLQGHRREPEAAYWYGSALQMSAQIALKEQQGKKALQFALDAQRWLQQQYPHTRQREKAKISTLLGAIYGQAGDLKAALLAYQAALQGLLPAWEPASSNAVPDVRILYSESLLTDALAGKAAVLERMQQPDAALAHYLIVFNAVHKLQGVYYTNAAKLKEQELAKTRAGAAMQLAYTLWKKTGATSYKEQMLLIAEWSKAQVLAQERSLHEAGRRGSNPHDSVTRRMQQLEEAIAYYQREQATAPGNHSISANLQTTEYELSLLRKGSQQQAGPSDDRTVLTTQYLHRYLQALPRDVTLLEFFAGRDTCFIIEADKQSIKDIRVIAGSAPLQDTIAQFVQRWYLQGASAMLNAPRKYFGESAALYNALFYGYPWQADRRYLLIPDGQFSYLPFDALPTNNRYRHQFGDWPFLMKQVNLSQAWSLQTWYQQQSTQYPVHRFTGFFVAKGKDQPQPALAVQDEYKAIEALVQGDYYLDTAATWRQFTQQAGSLGVVHISSHAAGAPQGAYAYLQLYDQPFYLFDLRNRHFAPSLVVLGACKTADGAWLDGEGVNSLARGFTAAGAGGVVAGLWNVHDDAAREILQEFYRQLGRQQDAGLAMHLAKLHWLQTHPEQPALSLPYYWAAMQYSGHLQTVPLQPPGRPNSWLYWIAGVLLVGAIGLFLKKKYLA